MKRTASAELRPHERDVAEQLKNISEAYPKKWWRPMDIGGHDGSHHSRTLAKLVRFGVAESRPWGGLFRGSKRYRWKQGAALAVALLALTACVAVPIESIPAAAALPGGEDMLGAVATVDSWTGPLLPDIGEEGHPFEHHRDALVRQASRETQVARDKCWAATKGYRCAEVEIETAELWAALAAARGQR